MAGAIILAQQRRAAGGDGVGRRAGRLGRISAATLA